MKARWPESIELTATPTRLREAVGRLPKSRYDPHLTVPHSKVRQLRERLLQIPVEELVNFRLHPRALEALPYLAVEVKNAELRKRVIQIGVNNFDALSWSTLARLLPYLYLEDTLRRPAHRRARKDPPVHPLPRWLTAHWRASLGPRQPGAELAIVESSEQPILARLLPGLGLQTGSPLATRVLEVALEQTSDAQLRQQPYTETLRFIEQSGAAAHLRSGLLHRLLELYLPAVGSPAQLEAQPALQELLALAHKCHHGWPDESSSRWGHLSEPVVTVARWAAASARARGS